MRLPLLDFLKRRADPAEPPPRPVKKAEDSAYHAVEISCGMFACEAAMALCGKRFLSGEAPPLPLKGCDQSECTCGYMHRADRRAGARRDADMGIRGFEHPVERRGGTARRATDRAPGPVDTSTDYFQYATQTRLRRADLAD